MMTSPTGLRSGNRQGRAFTLIELILVMALLMVVIGLIAPSLGNFFRGRNLDSEAHRFLSLSRYARSRAVSEGVPMLLWLDPDGRQYGVTEEFSYTTQDDRAVSYPLEPDVDLQLDQRGVSGSLAGGLSSGVAAPVLPKTLNVGANAVVIRFQPDGFISETSPQSLWFRERPRDGGQPSNDDSKRIWLTQTLDRITYEVQTNNLAFVRR